MSQNSKIEWTDHTFNPWWGCTKVSAGCKNCYAEMLDNRWKGGHWGLGSDRRAMSIEHWRQPLKWNEAALRAGRHAKVFCASMADVFEDHPQVGEYRAQLFELIERTPFLIWQLLTKRPENIMDMLPIYWTRDLPFQSFPKNVWIGTSVENQAAANSRIPHLLKVPASVRFLSCEPLLGPIDINNIVQPTHSREVPAIFELQWVIVGGESGPNARPMHPHWVRSLRSACEIAHVPFFFKQWGEWRLYDHYAGDNAKPLGMFQNDIFRYGNIVWDFKKESVHMARVGKKTTGRLLDGREWNEFPQL